MTLANQATPSSTAAGPLAGVRVLDLTRQIAGPYCTKLLADYGADVIKIEQPEVGDPARHIPPYFHDQPDPEGSLHFLYLNTSKRGMTLDLKSDEGRQTFLDLARDADVVVENFRPGVMAELGIGWETLHALNPRLVLTSISNFGQTGPYRDLRSSELVAYAMGGVMTISGREDRSPLKHGLSQAQYDGGAYGAWVTAMMLLWQAQGRTGQWVDISIMDVVSSTLVLNEPYYAWMGGIQGRRIAAGDGTGNGLSDIMPCADGYVIVQHRNSEPWQNVVDFLEEPALDDERFTSNEGRMLSSEDLYEILVKALAPKKKHDLFERAAKHQVLLGIAQDPSDLVNCPQLEARGYWVEVDHPTTGPMKYPGAPVRMPGADWAIRRPAPLLGQHTDEVLAELRGRSAQRADRRTAAEPLPDVQTRLPLEGVRVLDLTSVWAMPYAAGVMTDLGAEVIKIEALQRLDSSREAGVYPDTNGGLEPWNSPGTFALLNRGKRSITLNLAEERGRELFRELVKVSDVVIENYTARVMRNWKLDYVHLRELRPDLIMVSNTGYGHGGPWESYPVQGTSLEATCGIPNFTGYIGGRPWTVGQSYPDFVSKWHGLFAVLAAVRRRTLTGAGQWIDLAMYTANVAMQGEAMLDYIANGRLGERIGNRDHIQGVQGAYQTQGDDQWMAVAASSDAEWLAMRGVLGEVAWDSNAAPATLAAARARHDEVDRVVAAWAATQTREGAVDAMRAAGLPAGPCNDARDLLTNEHMRERGLYEMVDHPRGTGIGRRPIIGRAFRLSDYAMKVRRPAPPLGEANEYVLKELLGVSDEEFAQLEADKITGKRPPLEEAPSGLPIDALLGVRRIRVHDPDYRERLGIVPESEMAD